MMNHGEEAREGRVPTSATGKKAEKAFCDWLDDVLTLYGCSVCGVAHRAYRPLPGWKRDETDRQVHDCDGLGTSKADRF